MSVGSCEFGLCFFLMLSMSWNVRGLGRSEKRRKVSKVVIFHKPAILFIKETKLSGYDSSIFFSIEESFLTKGIGVDSNGTVGGVGVLTLWNEGAFSVKGCISNKSCIILLETLNSLNKEVVFCNVYAPNGERERKEFWDFISSKQ